MNKKISEILSESSRKETEMLVDNIDFDLDKETKKRITTNVLKKTHYSKTKTILVNKKHLISLSAAFAILFFITLVTVCIVFKKNSNDKLLNVYPTKTLTSATPSNFTIPITIEPTAIITVKPSSTPKPTITRTPTPIVEFYPAGSKAYWATYPKGIQSKDFEAIRENKKNNPVDDIFINGLMDFSYKSAYDLFKNNKGHNINYCPLSVYYAFAVAATGADGETYTEIMNALGLDGETKEYLSTQAGNMYRRLYVDNGLGILRIGSSLWLSNNNDISFKESFINNAVKNFYASLFNVDFSDKETSTLLGNWISKCTNDTLSPDIKIDPANILSIINTIYYQSSWAEKFDPKDNTTDKFYFEDNSEILCEFMNFTKAQAACFIGDDFKSAKLPLYEGEMVFVLPNEGININEILMSPEKLKYALTSPSLDAPDDYDGYELTISLPKFSVKSKIKLIETMQSLGINKAFNTTADFSGITELDTCITTLNQETFINVNEKGVSAGAVTDMGFGWGSPKWLPVDVILNRPFIYAIMYEGMPIFIGVCMDPTAK